MKRNYRCAFGFSLVVLATVCSGASRLSAAEPAPGRDQVVAAMRRAATYYVERVAVHGGYVYHYSLDLKVRWGEGRATAHQIWVQPPGTPTVGMALVDAWEATGDRYYLEAARKAAEALVYGRLRSGGWTNAINMEGRANGQQHEGGRRPRDGNTSLDDGQTQSAIQLLVRVDQALKFDDPGIHEAVMASLDALLGAQFANGGFPQVWRKPVSPQPVRRAQYPRHDWRTEGRIKNYWDMYTLNDNVCGYVSETLALAHQVYGEKKYLAALRKLGDFLLLAQMPEPQPAWAQQYNYQMEPIWARRFEPPGVSGDESQEAIATLIMIAETTGDLKYLEPIPAAIAYLKRSLLSDGQLARYYELKSNKPLYMQRRGDDYHLTYDDRNLPKHYGWKTSSRLNTLERQMQDVRTGNRRKPSLDSRRAKAVQALDSLDNQGRWVSTHDGERLVGQAKFEVGAKYLSSAVFSRNLSALSAYLASMPKAK